MRHIETELDLAEGLAALKLVDPVLARLASLSPPLTLRRRAGGLEGLLAIIVAQQLSVQSANAIWKRVEASFAPFEPAILLAADDIAFRECGLSAPKIRTIRSIADAIAVGQLNLSQLSEIPADDAHAALCTVKGIGPWTADIYLMFCIGHADAFASGDLALQEALRIALDHEKRPNAKELAVHAECWRPWRSIAARLLWAYYAVAKKREGIIEAPKKPKTIKKNK